MPWEGTKSVTIANRRQNSWIISLKVKHLVANVISLMLVTNSACIKKRNINQNVGDSVAEGTVSEPKCHFQQ